MRRTIKEFFRDLFESIKHLKRTINNIKLCRRYPFLKVRNVWTGKVMHNCYNWTLFDEIPEGWRKAFGKQLCEELRKDLLKCKYLKKYRIVQIKEKYGTLRIYDNGFPEDSNVSTILNKYEDMSMCYCINCGKPVRYVSRGWINYLCEDCAKDVVCDRVTKNDIPKRIIYKTNCKEEVESEVDFYELWDISKYGQEKISYKLPLSTNMYDMCYCNANCSRRCARKKLPKDGVLTVSDFTTVCIDFKEKE